MDESNELCAFDRYISTYYIFFIYIYISHKYYVIPRKSHHCNSVSFTRKLCCQFKSGLGEGGIRWLFKIPSWGVPPL